MSRPSNTFVLDNGAYSAKVGFSPSNEPKNVPNCIMKAKSERRRPFIGDQIEDCRDASGLFYMLPFQKGYLVNWDIEKNVWDYIFSKECCPVDFPDTAVVVTEPYFNFHSIQEAMTEIFFEEYECSALLRINAGDLSCFQYGKDNPSAKCCLVVDAGYSFTHVAPYILGKKFKEGIIRIDVGGKLLTNHLKEIISYRQLNVMEEYYVINQVKEDACFVSQDFYKDMEIASKKDPENIIVRDYILPDFSSIRRGYMQTPERRSESENQQQILHLTNERFAVPEIIFHPSDVGISQVGVSEAIQLAINKCPLPTQSHLYMNILLVGGCALFPGFKERLQKEIRAIAPEEYDVCVTVPEDCVNYAWQGGSSLTSSVDFHSLTVTREEYEEEGHNICFERFNI